MGLKGLLAGALAVLATPALAADAGEAARSAERIRAHVAFLADDLLQGREAGAPGFDIAAAYVASQLAQMGVKPGAADGTYFQKVPLAAYRPAGEGAVLITPKAGAESPLIFGEDYVPGADPQAASTHVRGDLVFAGYGVSAPGHDDYAGLDVKGKIVVVLNGAPKTFQTEERAYYANGRTKRRAAEAHGAIGFVSLNTPEYEARRPFEASVRGYRNWSMSWRDAQGATFTPAASVPSLASLSTKGAAKLFHGAPRTFAEAVAAAEAGTAPRFALPMSLDATLATELKNVESRNVVGRIDGADPKLKDEVVVLSAHLDHVGITAPVKGDAINNGALDNASGVATTLEVARAFEESKPPRRTVLFLLNTAEEKGLIGAEYFALNPPSSGPIVANVNLDMPILTYDFVDVVAFGSERSAIGPAVRRAAAGLGVKLSPDPLPEEGLFTRSDHFRFVEQGVPSVMLMTGFQNGGEAAFRSFLRDHYHKPSDDLSLPIDYAAGAKFAALNYAIARELADADQRPAWNEGDFFGALFARKR